MLAANCGIHIKESGAFGNGASATPGSGTLIARALIDFDNSVTPVDLYVVWTFTFTSSD